MTNLSNLTGKVKDFLDGVEVELKKKASSVTLTEDANKLENKTVSELTTASRALATSHANQKNNPHAVTPAQVGSYSIEDFERTISNYITSGIVPISRYGDLSFSPPGISGSFEGATTVKTTSNIDLNYREQYSMFLEDDGTLMFLRNGTDGSTFGVYYGYIQGAINGIGGKKPIVTAHKYSPLFLNVGEYVKYLYQGGNGILAGLIENDVTKETKCFIVLMNGSLNSGGHTCVLLDSSWDPVLNKSECILSQGKVYILENKYAHSHGEHGRPLEYHLYSVDVSDFNLVGSNIVTPNQLSIVESIGFDGVVFNNPGTVKLSQVLSASDPNACALVIHDRIDGGFIAGFPHISGSGRMMTTSAPNRSGDKIRSLMYFTPRYNAPNGGLAPVTCVLSFTIDLTTMKAQLDPGLEKLTVRQSRTSPNTLEYSGNIRSSTGHANFLGHASGDISTRMQILNDKCVSVSCIRYSPQQFESIYFKRWDDNSSMFDLIQVPLDTKVPNHTSVLTIPNVYGTPIGDSIDGFRLMPDNKAIVITRNSTSTEANVLVTLAESGESLVPNYQHRSIGDGVTRLGLPLSTERIQKPNDGVTNRKLANYLCEIDESGYNVYGTVLRTDPNHLSSHVTIDNEFNTTGTVSVASGLFDDLMVQALTASGHINNGFVGWREAELVIPQNPLVPVYAMMVYTDASEKRWVHIFFVDTDGVRSGVITKLNFSETIIVSDRGTVALAGGGSIHTTLRQGNHYIYKTTDGFMIVGNPNLLHAGNGSVSFRYRFFYETSTGGTSGISVVTSDLYLYTNRFMALPGHGVGETNEGDLGTKLLFRPLARNKTEFVRWNTLSDAPTFVLISQEAAQGWTVYFSEEMPVIINGSVGVVSPIQVNLTDIKANPTNTVFYVYVVDDNGSFSYLVLSNYVEEEINTLLIGTITTDNTRIVSVDVDKVTKFAGKTLSVVPKGQSIPVTAGLPSQDATLANGWF